MTEVSFARQFLALLDSRPIKYQPDYAADLRTLEITGPYTLPRIAEPMRKVGEGASSSSSNGPSGATTTVTVRLKSLRNPPLDLKLEGVDRARMTVLELKKAVAAEVGLPAADKVRLLHRKKPCSDMKTVADVLGEEGAAAAELELAVMVIGGVPDGAKAQAQAQQIATPPQAAGAAEDVPMADAPATTTKTTTATTTTAVAAADAPVAVGPSGAQVLDRSDFWKDLEGFLGQRVKDAAVAAEATQLFEKAWKERPKS